MDCGACCAGLVGFFAGGGGWVCLRVGSQLSCLLFFNMVFWWVSIACWGCGVSSAFSLSCVASLSLSLSRSFFLPLSLIAYL